MANYYYINPNPKGLHTRDCVIRAFAFFFGTTWREAFMDLINWCAERGLVDFNYRSVYNEYLKEKGYNRRSCPEKGMTVSQFMTDFADDNAVYIVSCKQRHLTIVHNKDVLDTFDCRQMTVDGYWRK